jgi:hypothetical protein
MAQLMHTRVTYETHRSQLEDLWSTFYPDKPYTGPNVGWVSCGFQQKDPVSDIRGGGELALKNLIYAMKVYPALFEEVSTRLEKALLEYFYPFAVAGINVTGMLADIFSMSGSKSSSGGGVLARLPYWHFMSLESFNELYCISLELVDREYRCSQATYMDFNFVLHRCKAALVAALSTPRCRSVEDVRSILNICRRPKQGNTDCHRHRNNGLPQQTRNQLITESVDLLGIENQTADSQNSVSTVAWEASFSEDGHVAVPDNAAFWEAFGVSDASHRQQHSHK